MSSSMASRFARLHQLVQPDLEALPSRPLSPEADTISDSDTGGGISISADNADTLDPKTANQQSAKGQSPSKPSVPAENAERRFVLVQDTASSSNAHDQTVESSPSPLPDEIPERRFVWLEGVASSYNLGTNSMAPSRPSTTLPPTTLSRGDLSKSGQYFCPLLALSKYPYKHCNRDVSQDIATRFFDAGKFWAREWDLYYVWDLEGDKPLILITEDQFKALLWEINAAFDLGLKVTPQQRNESLFGRFPDHPRCRPRYLARVLGQTREQVDTMATNAPPASFASPGQAHVDKLEPKTLEDFKKIMEDMWDAQKNKNKAAREKKNQQRAVKQHDLVQRFKRAQRYLGLRPSDVADLAAIDPLTPAPFPFDQSVVFVCVDVESWERVHSKITEIGIATLDTRDLVGIPPGNDGENWRSKIRARHFRINENKHLVNHEFIAGCPERFLFGTSEFINLQDAKAQVEACFKSPFCAVSRAAGESSLAKAVYGPTVAGQDRKLIFLGHDTMSDVRYLQQVGFNPLELPNMLESLDTAALYRVWRREQNATSLGRILHDFDIAGFSLHNGGNDAVYTVQAMLAVCAREATIRGTSAMLIKREEDKAARQAALEEEAKTRAKEEFDGWSETEDNGGPPQPIALPEKKSESARFEPIADHSARDDVRGRGRGRPQGEVRGEGRGRGHRGSNGEFRGSNSTTGFITDRPTRGYHNAHQERFQRGDYHQRGHNRELAYRGRGRGRSQGRGYGTSQSHDNEGVAGFSVPQDEPKVCDLIDL